jgi:glycosyltransferase involved in cell wall biosynthesis
VKILGLNSADIIGGAARAAFRLHRGLREIGVDTELMVQLKLSEHSWVLGSDSHAGKAMGIFRREIEQYALNLFTGRESETPFNIQVLPDFLADDVNEYGADIVHLHWICAGFIRIETLEKFEPPIIWTMHDMWPFTGGCHYSGECERYARACGRCPQLDSGKERDTSHWILKRKRKNWRAMDLHLVSPSHWLAERARESMLFKDLPIEVIPNGLDLNVYKPMDRPAMRAALGLDQHKKYVLFSAMTGVSDSRKGFDLLIEALEKLAELNGLEIEVLVPGATEKENMPDVGLPVHYLGRLHDDLSMAICYNAADVFIAPSRQDNLPNTVMEAMACGTPCAAFDVGGMPDMIEHMGTGYLARPFDVEELARGVSHLLESPAREEMMQNARLKAETEFGLEVAAGRYRQLYERILSKRNERTSHSLENMHTAK